MKIEKKIWPEYFKKVRATTIAVNSLFFVVMIGTALLAVFSKDINNILFSVNFLPEYLRWLLNFYFMRYFSGSYGFLWQYVWSFCVIFLIPINFYYFEVKRKYYISEHIIQKEDKNFKKIVFYFFLLTTIINLLFVIFVFEEIFMKTYGFTFSEDVFVYSITALIPNIMLMLAAKFL